MSTPSHSKLHLVLLLSIIILALLIFSQLKVLKQTGRGALEAPLLSEEAFDVPFNTVTDPVLGNPGAPLTLIMYGDLHDKKTREYLGVLSGFVSSHLGQARLVWKDYPAPHTFGFSDKAHAAAWCAGEQKKFWPYVTTLLKSPWKESSLAIAAEAAGLEQTRWATCLSSPRSGAAQTAALTAAQTLGIASSPVIFINNHQLNVETDIDLAQMLSSFIE